MPTVSFFIIRKAGLLTFHPETDAFPKNVSGILSVPVYKGGTQQRDCTGISPVSLFILQTALSNTHNKWYGSFLQDYTHIINVNRCECKDNANREQSHQACLSVMPRCSLSYAKIMLFSHTEQEKHKIQAMTTRLFHFFRNGERNFPESGKHFPERGMEMPHGIRTHHETPARERRACILDFACYRPGFCVLYDRESCNTY